MSLLIFAGVHGWSSAQSVSSGYIQAGQTPAKVIKGKLYLIDPYLLPSAQSGTISSDSIIAAIQNGQFDQYKASAIIQNGTSTAIAVFAIEAGTYRYSRARTVRAIYSIPIMVGCKRIALNISRQGYREGIATISD